jgi:hypothetical protein
MAAQRPFTQRRLGGSQWLSGQQGSPVLPQGSQVEEASVRVHVVSGAVQYPAAPQQACLRPPQAPPQLELKQESSGRSGQRSPTGRQVPLWQQALPQRLPGQQLWPGAPQPSPTSGVMAVGRASGRASDVSPGPGGRLVRSGALASISAPVPPPSTLGGLG